MKNTTGAGAMISTILNLPWAVLWIGGMGLANLVMMLLYAAGVRRCVRRGRDLKATAVRMSEDALRFKALWAEVEAEKARYEAAAEEARRAALQPPLDLVPMQHLEQEYAGRLCCGLFMIHRREDPGFAFVAVRIDRARALAILAVAHDVIQADPNWPFTVPPAPPTPPPAGGGHS